MDATRPPLPRLAAAAAAVTLVVAGVVVAATAGGDGGAAATAAAPATVEGATSAPGTAPTGAVGWTPWDRDAAGRPLRWDPCTPVRFVLRPDGAPPGAEADLAEALRRLAAATGLDLRLDGTTDEAPSAARPLVVRAGAGWRWAPVLVAWAAPGAGGTPLGPHDRGVAVPVAVRDGDRHALVTGQVVLNAARTDLRPGFGDRADAWGATLLHELGHLLGLDHVDDPAQLMAAAPGAGPVVLGTGDLAGLAAVGAEGGCVATPSPTVGRGLG